MLDDYFDPISGLLRTLGILKKDTKKPFNSVPNEQTTVITRTVCAGK